MARPEAIALAGFFPTPKPLLARIAAIFGRVEEDRDIAVVDPCAGEGDAVLELVTRLSAPNRLASLYAIEMEATRAETMRERARAIDWSLAQHVLQGDAFRARFSRYANAGASLLFLNPPYDTDREFARLEHRFLERFTGALCEGGFLLFLVPHYALSASADYLALHYEVDECFRFPEGDFAAYKQVVLVARRREERLAPDPEIAARVRAWSEGADGMPELPREGDAPLFSLPSSARYSSSGLSKWEMQSLDFTTLASRYSAWSTTTKTGSRSRVPGIEPELPIADMLLRTYPVATPPRPAHIAAGIASGLFNGARVTSKTRKFPPLLVKGVFDREYKTIDERTNEDGDVTSVVQVQQPKLVTTILDLRAKRYYVLGSDARETAATSVSTMTVADLLRHYGESLMGVMRAQCPVLYEPSALPRLRLVSSPRKLFTAQAHAARALVKLLERGNSAILLGEIGSGKTTVSLIAARTTGARRPLILCPPHLLQSWRNEAAAVLPNAEVRVLSSIADVEEVARIPRGKTVISVLSREAAKLGHAWAPVEGACPKCGSSLPKDVDLAKKRARCEARRVTPVDRLARIATNLAEKLAPHAPTHPTIATLVRGRHAARRLESLSEKPSGEFRGLRADDEVFEALAVLAASPRDEGHERAILMTLLAVGDDALTARVSAAIAAGEGTVYYDSSAAHVALLLPPRGEAQANLARDCGSGKDEWNNPWGRNFKTAIEGAEEGLDYCRIGELRFSWKDAKLELGGHKASSIGAALEALAAIARCGKFSRSKPCGEPLFQAVPEPRRVALAQHIARYYPGAFDFLILDEGHEYASDTSAQSFSAHRLTGLGLKTILMTGTIMNGYAESLFVNMWALSPDFRREFARDEKQRFVDRYGYRKRVVTESDERGEVVAYGSQSDRVTRSERVVGNAPGVLPLFLLRHLLPISVTLHKADLAIDLPPCTQHRCDVEPSPEQRQRFVRLQEALVKQIKSDRFEEGLAGKLWGQLAELPSYLDRATSDVGNCDAGDYEIRYPENVLHGRLVASESGFDPRERLPKEEWMLETVQRELAEGRNVMVFGWHVKLLPRLARLIEDRIGESVAVLYADKVGTAKRQDWIDREVVRKKRRVLVTNPVAIQTGLNNLVHFASEVWMENPAVNPVVFRQAIGRVDRIGQRLETRIFFPVYKDTLQEKLYDLLMKKVAVSVSTDGLDNESMLTAAGVGESDALAALSIGRQLWALMNEAA